MAGRVISKPMSPEEAIDLIGSGQTVFVHGAAATPSRLLEALVARADELSNVEIVHLHTMGPARYANPEFAKAFRVTNLFVGGNMRSKIDFDRVDYLPCFLSEIPNLFLSRRKKIDVALISLSTPDAHGYCSLGTSVDVARSAVDNADLVIAQVNTRMPRTHGAGFIHLSKVAAWTEVDDALPETVPCELEAEELKIGRLVADLIEDGSTLQAGIGAIPDAVLAALKGHRHLGIHTEMWSDHMLDLIENGSVDNSRKRNHLGVSVASFCYGSRRVYEAVHDNPNFIFLPADRVNSTDVIARNPKVVAINSAVEIDLTGQICADSIGTKVISGVGGQMDFLRGAALSHGGKPIVALKSRTASGKSKIVAQLSPGAGVVTTRAHVHYVVTEYGVANLYGLSIGERVRRLIEISHPSDRESLERTWHEAVAGQDPSSSRQKDPLRTSDENMIEQG
ncbi:MAG: acetyl-CoA hydrolase/transferase C-terminal domain-containing protein [Bdellovibrionota bacterium]